MPAGNTIRGIVSVPGKFIRVLILKLQQNTLLGCGSVAHGGPPSPPVPLWDPCPSTGHCVLCFVLK